MLAIIPARGGSKGLPGKNIKSLNGEPLIAYTIKAALNSKYITRIIISTDDPEIAMIAANYGAEVPFMRPDSLSEDNSKSLDVLKYTVNRLQYDEEKIINELMVLQPTSPLRTSLNIDEAIKLFYEKKADSVISYCAEHHPIKWHKYINNMLKFENIFEDTLNNRQNERVSYFPNGAIYVFKTELIMAEKYYTDKTYAYIMDRKQSVDIDTIDDFEYAEFLIKKSNE